MAQSDWVTFLRTYTQRMSAWLSQSDEPLLWKLRSPEDHHYKRLEPPVLTDTSTGSSLFVQLLGLRPAVNWDDSTLRYVRVPCTTEWGQKIAFLSHNVAATPRPPQSIGPHVTSRSCVCVQ